MMSLHFGRHSILGAALMLGALGTGNTVVAQTKAEQPCNVIASLPTALTSPGAYCLAQDLVSSSSGIEVLADDVAIDCKHHTIETTGGSAVGAIFMSSEHSRTTVRRCDIRGPFRSGVELHSGRGHLVEDNLIDGSLFIGIDIDADNSTVLRNRVLNTGYAAAGFTRGISVSGSNSQILENRVATVIAQDATNTSGIRAAGPGHIIRDNSVSDIRVMGAVGILGDPKADVRDNIVLNVVRRGGIGISITAPADAVCRRNFIVGFTTGLHNCVNAGGNTVIQ